MVKSRHGGIFKNTVALIAILALATGCAGMSARQKGFWQGAAAGAAVGAAAGPIVTHDEEKSERGEAAIIGAVAGGIIGGVIGMMVAKEPPPPPPPKPEPKVEPPPPPPPPKPVVKEPKPEPVVKERIVLRGINFDFDKADVKPEFKPVLDEAANILKRRTDVKVIVEGHTCSIGTDQYNQGLSERRAKSVQTYLTNNGVEKGRLSMVGYGEARPIADNKTKEGRSMNRRVEFKVME